jgi:ankyrin repeat protein
MRYIKYLIVITAFISISAGAQVSSLQRLLDAVELGDRETVRSALSRGMDVNSTDELGNTLLMIACHFGRREIASDLLEAGADIRRQNRAGDDALMLAALKGELSLGEGLVRRGAPIEREGWSALHYAAFGGHAAMVRLLIEKGAAKNRLAPNGYSALMLAVRGRQRETVRELLLWDPDLEIRGPSGETALSLALGTEDSAVVGLLRRAGAVQ